MQLSMEESFELAPAPFVRHSKLRKSFRIRHRYNSKLPPAAILFMKSLEQNKVSKFDSIRSRSTFYTSINGQVMKCEDEQASGSLQSSTSDNAVDQFDPLADDEQQLLSKSPVLRRRNSIKKLSGKKKLKMNKLISFFRK